LSLLGIDIHILHIITYMFTILSFIQLSLSLTHLSHDCRAAGPDIPPGRIFGSGTALDSSRLRSLVGASFDVDTNAVHGYVIGEHGDSSLTVWSGINVAGSPILPPGEAPKEVHKAMHADVVAAGARVIKKKGYTNWAIGLAVARIASAVLTDERAFMPVSTCVRGYEGVKEDVFLSLPCCLGATGVVRVLDIKLTEAEAEAFRESATSVWEVQAGLWEAWE
jgi:L-lactate dehydrogenase